MKVTWAPEDGMVQLTTESVEEIVTLLGLSYHKHTTAGAVSTCPVCVRNGDAVPEAAITDLLEDVYEGLFALLPPTKEDTEDVPRTDA